MWEKCEIDIKKRLSGHVVEINMKYGITKIRPKYNIYDTKIQNSPDHFKDQLKFAKNNQSACQGS